MLTIFRKNLSAVFILLLALTLGAALSGCMAQTNGVSVGTLNKPNASPDIVLSWASEAAVAAYTYDYANYQTSLQTTSRYFTPGSWKSFMAALVASGNLTKIIKNKMTVSATVIGKPVLLAQGELAGRYSWRIQLPLLVTYQGAKTTTYQQSIIVTMLVVRTSPLEGSAGGLGIKQFIALVKPQPAQTQVLSAATTAN